ncbi:MAG: abhydrolase domain-containing 18, partial [Myxococcales bacterium]
MAGFHWADRLYVRLSPVGSYFDGGWGDEASIERVVGQLRSPDPARPIAITWGPERRERWGVEALGEFVSPVDDGTLPPESRRGRVLLQLPDTRGPGPVCIHLAATGEDGFERRKRLCAPLLQQGIGSLLLENPYYGARRPAAQRGSDISTVADLMVMGRAVVDETRSLAVWLHERGHRVGVSGYSMGGQMGALAAAFLPFPVAVASAAAPCTASQAFVDGLLARVTCWPALAPDGDMLAARARLTGILDATCLTRQAPPSGARAGQQV